MIEIAFIALIVANIAFAFTHLAAAEPTYGSNGKTFTTSIIGMLVAGFSFIFIFLASTNEGLSVALSVSAAISMILFIISLNSASSGNG